MKLDLKIYNLIYYRKVDGVKFHVRRASSTDYVLINSETFEKLKLTVSWLRKDYISDEIAAKEARPGIRISA